jgi:nicotinamidase-related amidase
MSKWFKVKEVPMNKKTFIEESSKTLKEIIELLDKKPSVSLEDLPSDNTVLVIVDMVNGFAKEGALKSPRVKDIIPNIVSISKKCDFLNMQKLTFADSHTNDSPEFDSYPPHCIDGTSESEIVDEIKEVGGYQLILKNSTNGFIEEGFQNWLKDNRHIDHFIVVGDCTDICIQQFAVTLKTWFNKANKKSRIIVPINAVETYDFELHNGNLMQVMSLYTMLLNGIEIVKDVN